MRIVFFLCCLFVNTFSLATPCKTERQMFIDNKSTKVWKTTICPHERLPLHTHESARVIIPDEDGELLVIYQSGKKSLIHLQQKTPVFLSLSQGKTPHQDENTGALPLHVMVIELKA